MTEETATPEQSDAEIHDKLMAQAEAADRGEIAPPVESSPSATQGEDGTGEIKEDADRAADSDQAAPDSPEPAAEGRKRGPDGKFLPKEAAPTKDETSTEGEQPADSKYARAKKDAERLDRSWKALDAEKEQIRAQAVEMRRLAQEVAAIKQGAQQQPQGIAALRFNSQQYVMAAQELKRQADKLIDEGDIDGAREKLQLATQSEGAARQANQAEWAAYSQTFANNWKADAEQVIAEAPDLGDPNSEAAQAMMELLDKKKYLGHVVGGFRDGAEFLYFKQEAAAASGLREENTKLKQEIERLNTKLNPSHGKGSATHSGPAKFSSMSDKEQHDYLEHQAELADAV